jgi:hypothetical protein
VEKEQLLAIGRPNRLCCNCNAPIHGVERHPSALKRSPSQVERLDYCDDCWRLLKEEMWESFWLTNREPRQRRVPKMNRRQRATALRALFESLRDRAGDEDLGPHLFLISHLLMKWGGLKWRENQTDIEGREVVVFEDAASGDTFEVPSVAIDEESLAPIKLEIEDFLRQFASEGAEVEL